MLKKKKKKIVVYCFSNFEDATKCLNRSTFVLKFFNAGQGNFLEKILIFLKKKKVHTERAFAGPSLKSCSSSRFQSIRLDFFWRARNGLSSQDPSWEQLRTPDPATHIEWKIGPAEVLDAKNLRKKSWKKVRIPKKWGFWKICSALKFFFFF